MNSPEWIKAVQEFLDAIKDYPKDQLFFGIILFVGVLLLLVGLGITDKWIGFLDKTNKMQAKVFGILFILCCFFIVLIPKLEPVIEKSSISKIEPTASTLVWAFVALPFPTAILLTLNIYKLRSKDVFLVYYCIAVPIAIGGYWAALAFTNGNEQLQVVPLSFWFVTALILIAVIWRALIVGSYLRTSGKSGIPLGLYQESNFVPYVLLIGSGVIAIILLILNYTRDETNRVHILTHFFASCVCLLVLRLLWEVIDKNGANSRY